MWLVIIAILGVVIWLAVSSSSSNTNPMRNDYSSPSRPSYLSNTPSTNEALEMIRDMFKDLSLNQRYAVYNFFDSLAQCVTSYSAKQKVQDRVRMAALELNINPSSADSRLQIYGLNDMFSNLGAIPKGAALDSIIATAYGISLMASGTVQGRDAKQFAETVFVGSLKEAGFSEDFIAESLERTEAFMNAFS
ncbi:MAG: hypothetical protein IKX31_03055 [Muribaculaceae bacterium]|nr:hypothetical protein [Muribaculaceae bacterium]